MNVKSQMKEVDKKIKRVQKNYREMESRGCYSDKEMAEKDRQLDSIKAEIGTLVAEKDRLWKVSIGIIKPGLKGDQVSPDLEPDQSGAH
ncbi:MAG: hypothetical protein HQK59_08510 [Deltaproteobacteria bacterium]|nr:hypothetical protein [Deltaproteobacteria bacterium]